MCLDLRVVLPRGSKDKLSAKRLAALSGLHVTGTRTDDGLTAFHFAADPGCSCGLLAEGFQINALAWPLTPQAASALAKALRTIASAYPSFTFSSAWLGSETTSTRSTAQLAEVLEELLAGTLKANLLRQVQ
jgi:hypothetical protein